LPLAIILPYPKYCLLIPIILSYPKYCLYPKFGHTQNIVFTHIEFCHPQKLYP
jgi:hypothetical protein